jgi:hypothetical protein
MMAGRSSVGSYRFKYATPTDCCHRGDDIDILQLPAAAKGRLTGCAGDSEPLRGGVVWLAGAK